MYVLTEGSLSVSIYRAGKPPEFASLNSINPNENDIVVEHVWNAQHFESWCSPHSLPPENRWTSARGSRAARRSSGGMAASPLALVSKNPYVIDEDDDDDDDDEDEEEEKEEEEEEEEEE